MREKSNVNIKKGKNKKGAGGEGKRREFLFHDTEWGMQNVKFQSNRSELDKIESNYHHHMSFSSGVLTFVTSLRIDALSNCLKMGTLFIETQMYGNLVAKLATLGYLRSHFHRCFEIPFPGHPRPRKLTLISPCQMSRWIGASAYLCVFSGIIIKLFTLSREKGKGRRGGGNHPFRYLDISRDLASKLRFPQR